MKMNREQFEDFRDNYLAAVSEQSGINFVTAVSTWQGYVDSGQVDENGEIEFGGVQIAVKNPDGSDVGTVKIEVNEDDDGEINIDITMDLEGTQD